MTGPLTMSAPASVRRAPLDLSPLDAIRRWPEIRPLAALVSAGEGSRWSRWSILACPAKSTPVLGHDREAFAESVRAAGATTRADSAGRLPFMGGAIINLHYEAASLFEPAAACRNDGVVGAIYTCPTALVHDNEMGEWWEVGDTGMVDILKEGPSHESGGWTSRVVGTDERRRFVSSVERALAYIRAGDVYQVNLSHPLRTLLRGAPRAVFTAVAERIRPWYGAYLDGLTPGEATLSWSPELLITLDARSREVLTRPIKGTLSVGEAQERLLKSEKDAAELAMIVDLMRNDMGRVADFGTVRVASAREAERHAGDGRLGVLHTVATVAGRLRQSENAISLLAAVFPAGSITGAPKIRAMQIIDELENRSRGPYCGSVGFISCCGNAAFNVAIRTAMLNAKPINALNPYGAAEGHLGLPVGAGIVSDSDPESEWEETLTKAAAIMDVIHPDGGAYR